MANSGAAIPEPSPLALLDLDLADLGLSCKRKV
jgi:hypothetical protein